MLHHDLGLTFDHVTPRWGGGPSSVENLVIACYRCNSMKDNDDPTGRWEPKTPRDRKTYVPFMKWDPPEPERERIRALFRRAGEIPEHPAFRDYLI